MGERIDGSKRLLLGVLWYLVTIAVGWIIAFVVFVWFIVDVLGQVITGEQVLPPSGGFVSTVWEWQKSNTAYLVFGRGSFQYTP